MKHFYQKRGIDFAVNRKLTFFKLGLRKNSYFEVFEIKSKACRPFLILVLKRAVVQLISVKDDSILLTYIFSNTQLVMSLPLEKEGIFAILMAKGFE